MIGIVIVMHGGTAGELLASVEHVLGRQPAIRALSVEADHDRTAKQTEITAAADAVDSGEGVVVLTDLFGGSPANLSLGACGTRGRRMIYGTNLATLIELVKNRDLPVDEAVRRAKEAGRKYIGSKNVSSD